MSSEQHNQDEDLYFEGGNRRSYWVRFSTMLSIAVIIATVGLYRNSGAVVIAAMLIAPLMTPILGIASAMVMGWTPRMLYLLAAVTVASFGTIGLAYVILFLADAPKGMLVPHEVLARTDPGLEELMVALAAGIAGAYVQMRKEEASLLPGVAIGVSLVPPLAATGMLLYFAEPVDAWEAALLYLTNLAAIVLSACGVFYLLGMRPAMRDKGYVTGFRLGAIATLVVVAILAIELSTATLERFREARDEERIVVAIKTWSRGYPIEISHLDVKRKARKTFVDIGLIADVPGSFSDQVIAPREMLPEYLHRNSLFDSIETILGLETIVTGRIQVRYASQWNLKTRERIGLPKPVTD
ncbi:MAG: DUF389 domain-containing protein [Pseudomonadota bacterium]|nr:DUF389 domain-containing protein [Pseudomonadota bacterium]